MQEINLKLWRNEQTQDWSVEINGLRHERVTAQTLEDLVESALIVTEKLLMDASTRLPQ
jgi:hypothetical protein